ncbi:histidine--tRNA ligase [Micromonospora noduli]|uniref:Histidine--tRNA ligase n=1 Tax=Micromonospora noduli TaxID=709876 RepID=A0A328N8X6_9ACTN|nr:histidine--tRNA ligase [Micromonospora noduli]RAO00045.1 Histidine--tRNA ligase [Micromonospora noduli]RAO08681.1 Histidine--tRNA ligase [Micromonospora noduli]RAO19203.1 Histidine--tRNA ligase [Micromonospora noduli]RAO26943.1 Histidine--tRNA ligase [Micromonospora noduli]RAO50521.1 Histidine--tRNA ligase [Micromonospora noduli]
MSKPTPISGFPEWTPGQRMIEQFVLDKIRATFELYGFAPLETRAVEPLDQLLRKGETSKEVYVIRRLHADAEGAGGDDQLGLHFDLTVPFARYVLENAGKLSFPFRRYQIQKVWRGERPQEGRYREFVQADIDIVDRDTLAAHHEAEMPLVIGDALRSLPIPPVTIQVNNRKICEGFYRGIGLTDPEAALRAVDKLDKIGPAKVAELLAQTAGASEAQAKACLALAEISAPDASFADAVRALGVSDPLLDEGIEELVRVVDTAAEHSPGLCVADLRIARGLDYYTGTVYETQLRGYERFGSICSGGRYDNLASAGTVSYPGVGISIGVTRLLGLLFGAGELSVSREVPTAVLVAVTSEEQRTASNRVAEALRRRGVPTEVSPSAAKFGKQIRYAERRGIPYVWFPGAEGAPDEVKDIRSGEQVTAGAGEWMPPLADVKPTVG